MPFAHRLQRIPDRIFVAGTIVAVGNEPELMFAVTTARLAVIDQSLSRRAR